MNEDKSTKLVSEAKSLYAKDKSAWEHVYRKGKKDLKFLSDAEHAQWDEADAQRRLERGRPVITIDQLGQFVHQVVNDARANTPTITVIPAGEGSDQEKAEVLKGLIRNIEYKSDADTAYDTAINSSVKCSIGFIRVCHDYANEVGFEQDLVIKRVVNPFKIMLDSDSMEADGSDAKHGHILEEISVSEFKKRYPGKDPVSFDCDEEQAAVLQDDEKIVICEFYKLEEEHKEIALLASGNVVEYQEGIENTLADEIKTRRKIKRVKVRHVTLSGKEELESTYFPGKYIPIVPVYGEEAWEDGKRHIHSLIRRSKEAQRMFNLWKSLETEILMKAPKAPVMAAEGQIEDYAEDWKDPDKSMALRYKTVDAEGNPAPPPIRLQPPPVPTGVVNASRQTVDDIKSTMGIYNAALGERSNETSGVAINQRKIEGDMATYHFGDNLIKSITHVGRILVSAIPEIYDTQRIIRIIGEEDEPKMVGINGEVLEDQDDTFNLTEGTYDVRVVTGAPFTTRRQEAAKFFSDIISTQPELFKIMGDLLFKNMDFTGAPAMAERMKKAMDPKFLEDEEQDNEKMVMAQQLQQAQGVIEQLSMQVKQKGENEQLKAQMEMAELQHEEKMKLLEAQLKEKEMALKEQELLVRMAEIQAQPYGEQPPEIRPDV